MIVMQQQHKNSKEGKDLFRKSIIRYQIYPAIYSQLDCFEVPKLGSKPQKKLTAPLKAKSLELQYVSIYIVQAWAWFAFCKTLIGTFMIAR